MLTDQDHKVARLNAYDRTRGGSFLDDAMQEGLIRAWEIRRRTPEATAAYVNTAIRRRINDVAVRGYPQMGELRPRNWSDASKLATTLIVELKDDEEDEIDRNYGIPDRTHETELSLVVRSAVGCLGEFDRRVVFLHVWRDLTFDQISPEVGMTPGGLRNRWWRVIAPTLRERLVDLAPRTRG